MSLHYYTITTNEGKFSAVAPYYTWKKVRQYFGIDEKVEIRRGASAHLPSWAESQLIKLQEETCTSQSIQS